MAITVQEINRFQERQKTQGTGTIHHYLSDTNFQHLKNKFSSPRTFKKGSFLYMEGDYADQLYYIYSGKVKLKRTMEDGKEITMALKQKGDLLGEFGFSEEVHNASSEIIEDCKVAFIHKKEIEALLQNVGTFAVEYMNWLSMTNRLNETKIRDLLLYGKSGALASTLIRMSNTYGIVDTDGIRLKIKLTNTEIGEFIGLTRESVNRTLNSWKNEGILTMDNGFIVIKNLCELKKICGCPSTCPLEICRL
ncbi:Crp/Fnr family transcriptional regulator [Bacillus sp. FJAT-44742]|uniref:Crp/Fnr family transcriptional regulator n=1 Tax=Bacillus sp. FJAT-44742 TaxID=2014005 RepID=UPI0018E1E9DC|nr:Crp/Fnr family transcriptional regulator [Bacillus sp. FJAT-44742]